MWMCREFRFNGNVVDFLNDNNHLINSVSITRNISALDPFPHYAVFFRLNDGVLELELIESIN